MSFDRDALARLLREARENRGMTQEAAASRLGLSRTVVAQIELGNRPVSDDELSRFSSVYEVSVADFTGTSSPGDDLGLSVFDVAPELLRDEETKARVDAALDLLRLAFGLDVALGLKPHAPLSTCFRPRVPSPKRWSKPNGWRKRSGVESALGHFLWEMLWT